MIPFTKMHGIGNDFVMVNAIQHPLDDAELPSLAHRICNRRYGVGSDGLILARKGASAPFQMRMFNPDGSESEMCGNGIRCFSRFLKDQGLWEADRVEVETGAGLLTLETMPDGQVQVDMGPARLLRREIPVAGDPDATYIRVPTAIEGMTLDGTAVSMGNPHLVFFVDDVAGVPLERWGPLFEHHPDFTNRTNVHFVQVADSTHLIQRTWERGAGVTLACGTGACACAVAAFLNGLSERSVTIRLPGGNLSLSYLESGHVLMTGPAETAFEGTWKD